MKIVSGSIQYEIHKTFVYIYLELISKVSGDLPYRVHHSMEADEVDYRELQLLHQKQMDNPEHQPEHEIDAEVDG